MRLPTDISATAPMRLQMPVTMLQELEQLNVQAITANLEARQTPDEQEEVTVWLARRQRLLRALNELTEPQVYVALYLVDNEG